MKRRPLRRAGLIQRAELFKALGDPVRLQLLQCLLHESACVTDLVERCGARQPRVSQHLSMLKDAGLARVKVDGKRRCYELVSPALVRAALGLAAPRTRRKT